MSVIYKQDQPDKTAELEQEIADLQTKETATAQLLGVAFQSAVMSDRASGTNFITDAMILSSVSLVAYPDWKPEQDYIKGEILRDAVGGLYFEVIAAHKSNNAYPITATFAYYRLIELEHEGTLSDPIPYPEAAGIVVNVVSGKYYSYKGSKYKATADMPNCVYPPDTAGMWQWEKVNTTVKKSRAKSSASSV